MRGSVRQFSLALLAATYTVFWTCGSAWHLSTCTHRDHADNSSSAHASAKKISGCCSKRSCTKHCSDSGDHYSVVPGASSCPSDHAPETPHDSGDCGVCQLFAQPLVPVSLSSVEISLELVETSDISLPLTVPKCDLLPATSRGPPAV
jgi:hypothetical protein